MEAAEGSFLGKQFRFYPKNEMNIRGTLFNLSMLLEN